MPIQPHHRQAAKLHPGSRAGENRKEKKILRVEQVERGEINERVHLLKLDLPSQRAEEGQKSGVCEAKKNTVEEAGHSALCQSGHGHKRRLRARAIVRRARKI